MVIVALDYPSPELALQFVEKIHPQSCALKVGFELFLSGGPHFVEKLVALNTTGIIATHDLSLCEIESELEEVKNYYFDAEIINDELYFDYTFKNGICKNRNASFLLKKMEII